MSNELVNTLATTGQIVPLAFSMTAEAEQAIKEVLPFDEAIMSYRIDTYTSGKFNGQRYYTVVTTKGMIEALEDGTVMRTSMTFLAPSLSNRA